MARKQVFSVTMHAEAAEWFRKLGGDVLAKGIDIAYLVLTDSNLFDEAGLMMIAKRFDPAQRRIPGLRPLLLPDVFGDTEASPHEPDRLLTPEQCERLRDAFENMVSTFIENESPPAAPLEGKRIVWSPPTASGEPSPIAAARFYVHPEKLTPEQRAEVERLVSHAPGSYVKSQGGAWDEVRERELSEGRSHGLPIAPSDVVHASGSYEGTEDRAARFDVEPEGGAGGAPQATEPPFELQTHPAETLTGGARVTVANLSNEPVTLVRVPGKQATEPPEEVSSRKDPAEPSF